MVEFRSAEWAEKYFSAQSGRTSSQVTLSPSYTKQFPSSIDQVAWPVQREDCRGKFQKKIFNEAEEIASLNMGLGTTILPLIFSADLSNVYRKVLYLMYAISTLLFLAAGKASRVPKVTSYFSSIVETLHDMQITVAGATQLCRPNVGTIG